MTAYRKRKSVPGRALRTDRSEPPEAKFLFKHTFVQDAAYRLLLRADRRDVHRRIAEALEAHFPDIAEIQPELMAHHFTGADMAEPAVRG